MISLRKDITDLMLIILSAVVKKREMEGSFLRNQNEIDNSLQSYSNHSGINSVPGKQNIVPPPSCNSY
jgi:hypothetical protein